MLERYPTAKLYFVIGTDQYDQLDKWYRIDELKAKITFVIVNRGQSTQDVEDGMVAINISFQHLQNRIECIALTFTFYFI